MMEMEMDIDELQECVTVNCPDIEDMPRFDSEKTALGHKDSAWKRYDEWRKTNYMNVVTAIVDGVEKANGIRAKIEEYAQRELGGRPCTDMDFLGIRGDCDGVFAFYRITVRTLKLDEASRLAEAIKTFF